MHVRMILLAAAGVALGTAFAVSAAAQDSKPEKKVWTNEDLQELGPKVSVSVVGAPPANPAKQPSGTAKTVKTDGDPAKNAQWYRERLQPLHAELAKLDLQLDDLRAFEAGSYRSSSAGVSVGYLQPLNPAEEIKKLSARRDEVQTRIGALEDEARHNGILPGALH